MAAKKRSRLKETFCTASTEQGEQEMADLHPALQKAIRCAVECCSIFSNDYNGSIRKC